MTESYDQGSNVLPMSQSTDMGIPSDSPYHGAEPSAHDPWTVRTPVYNPQAPARDKMPSFDHLYQPSRFKGTICDIPDIYAEMSPTPHQEKMARRWRIFSNIAVMAVALGFIAISLWAAAYRFGDKDREIMAQIHGWEGR